MAPLIVLTAVLPPLLLLLGVALGVVGARWWVARHAAAADTRASAGADVEAAMADNPLPLSITLPPGRKASSAKLQGSGGAIHVVASATGLAAAPPPPGGSPLASRRGHLRPVALHTPDEETASLDASAATAEEQLRCLVGGAMGGSNGSLSPGGRMGHRKSASTDLGQLVRAGPSVISQVIEDWEARSTLYRILSMEPSWGGSGPLPPPGGAAGAQPLSPQAGGGLLSPAAHHAAHHAAALFSPTAAGAAAAGGERAMPPGEVHMDEIDLLECIGKGGYGCVYKAAWRGAGVAVKYIKCPTDDSDSLGRAIREVVLSKKMSHPNVVQCYSWTVLTDIDNGRSTPGSASGRSSPREQSSFTSRRRASLQRGGGGGRRGSLEALRPVRRGLDLRFNSAAAGGSDMARAGSSPTALHRITERPTQEGSVLQLEIEAALGPVALQPAAIPQAVAELGVNEQQQEHQEGAMEAGCSSREASPEVEVAALLPSGGKPSAIKLAAGDGRSPSGSPGIQAVHAPDAAAEPAAGDAASEASPSPQRVSELSSPQRGRDACSVEPATLPSSPFASAAAQARRSSSSSDAGALPPQLPHVRVAVEPPAASALVRGRLSTEDENSEDVYARFGSYEEMVAYFRDLAAEGEAQAAPGDGSQPGTATTRGLLQSADMSRCASLARNELGEVSVTAASSFSDVLSVGGFMLEGSSNELAVLSQPSSPRHQLHHSASLLSQPARPGQGAWLASASAGSSQGASPRVSAAAAGLSGMAPAPQPSRFSRAASAAAIPDSSSLPLPAWIDVAAGQAAVGESAEQALSSCVQQQQQQQVRHSSQDAPAAEQSAQAAPAPRHGSTVSLSGWQPAVAASNSSQQQHASMSPSSSDTLPVASAWAAEYGVAAEAAARSALAGTSSLQQQRRPHQPGCEPGMRLSLGGARGGAASGSVTPRIGSLSNLGPAGSLPMAADPSLGAVSVTPRAQSLVPAGPLQVSPRAPLGLQRSPGSATGLQRLEELRAEAERAASCDRLSLGSHNDSFNSEEGFGSPVKQRCGGVRDVFQLEELRLAGQEALMVVVMEYCDLGSLRKALKRGAFRPSAKWPFQTTYRALLRTAQEVAKGMGYIHEFNIVHGDLKPGNVLLKTHKVDRRGYIAKVADFGLSRPLDVEETHASLGSALGTIAYSAPETFATNRLRKPSDVYAFGIMLWEMFYCEDPYDGLMDGQICLGVSDGTLRPEFRQGCPEPYRRLAEQCWHQDPEARPSFEQVDAELVRIELDFRRVTNRQRSQQGLAAGPAAGPGGAKSCAGSAASGGASLPASRPGSPMRGGRLHAADLAD